ncbi:MAG: hypothetical protein MJ208_00695 [Bacilli bacterium]|nr:hypothetical protein [Bacilli bacterium]
MIDLVFKHSFIVPLKEYVSKVKNKKDLVYLLNQIDNLKSSYLYLYNYIKSTIYIDYILEDQKDGIILRSQNEMNKEINKFNTFINNIQKSLKSITKLSGAASYMDTPKKVYWTYYNAGPIRYKDNMDINLAKELILSYFNQCINIQNNIEKILNILISINKSVINCKSVNKFNNYFYSTISKHFLKHFDEFENVLR